MRWRRSCRATASRSRQDQSQLSTDQAAQSALTSDAAAIKADEQKLAQDHTSIASAQTSRKGTELKDAQSLQSAKQQVASAQLGLKSTLASIAMKQAPPTPSALAGAQASVLQAQISLANAKKAYVETTLRAPVAGVVAAVNGTVGTQASGGGSSSNSSASSSLERERIVVRVQLELSVRDPDRPPGNAGPRPLRRDRRRQDPASARPRP